MAKRQINKALGRRLALVLALCLAFGSLTTADDRDLVREAGKEPYLYVIFDVSGSMNWTPPMAAQGIPGDSFAPAYGDDPNSKFYQAKSALYRVLTDPDLIGAVEWGFGTYNQDNVRVWRKHWIYTVAETTPPPWAAFLPYPLTGQPKAFGDHCMDDNDGDTTCDLDAAHGEIAGSTLGSCTAPQVLTSLEDLGELLSFPVLGDDGSVRTTEWVQTAAGRKFRVEWITIGSGQIGDATIVVEVRVREANPACVFDDDDSDDLGWVGSAITDKLTFVPMYPQDNTGRPLPGSSEGFMWQIEGKTNFNGDPAGFWNFVNDHSTTNHCIGWDPNNDPNQDSADGRNLKMPSFADPFSRGTAFGRGDIIPLDWQDEAVWGVGNTNRDAILRRLTPNWDPSDPAFQPELRSAPYFEDHPTALTGTNHLLPLLPAYVNNPPMLPNGSTPIGASMDDFENWYRDWVQVADGGNGDPTFGCRTVNLLILTDGDETCGGSPCSVATTLLSQHDIRTFVIGFGIQSGGGNTLDCIAQNGGTAAVDLDGDGTVDITGPILPENEDELVKALRNIITAIQPRPRSFAAAAVPQAAVNIQDKVYLTSFIPMLNQPLWPGRLDAYLRPVPLRPVDVDLPDGTTETRQLPNPNLDCGGTPQSPNLKSECHLWNAAEELIQQAADDNQILVGDYNLGTSQNERRVFYAQQKDPGTPDVRLPFDRPTNDADWQDLLEGMGICAVGDVTCGTSVVARDEALEVLDFFHRIKQAPDPANPSNTISYVLGDIFHSDPLVYGNPDSFEYWVEDAGGTGTLPLQDACASTNEPDGYRCFFDQQQFRRKVIFLGANDGQMHAFDAGSFRGTCESGQLPGVEFVKGEFDNGTGRELFSFVPRVGLTQLRDVAMSDDHLFSLDGKIAVGDIFIDPEHDGTPNIADRQWRSALVAGLREGGSGYYGLDITWPDTLDECNGTDVLPKPLGGNTGWVPSCINGGSDCGDLAYPWVLWEFSDNKACDVQLTDGRCDDDNNGLPDLDNSWSTPVIGRIKVIPEGDTVPVDMYVAIFGGGMDPVRKGMSDVGGNFVYILDMETGEVIYKREVEGSVPTEIAAVDTDQNHDLETLYFGTTAGLMYKVDLSQPQELMTVPGKGLRIPTVAEGGTGDWDPFAIFTTDGRPVYYPPAVIYVAAVGQYALSWGTGDREDLWLTTQEEGRIYMILDRGFRRADFMANNPLDERQFQAFDADSLNATADFLTQAPHGWFIILEEEERTLNRAFSLAGVTIISTYQPEQTIGQGGGVCVRTGDSRTFVVNTTNANGMLPQGDRYFVIERGFLSPPFVESGQTKNPDSGGTDPTADEIPDDLKSVMEEIRSLFPQDCRFANYTINIKAVRDDTGLQFLAAVPICIVETNWKDF